jgi:hypothetical protein
VSAKSWYQQSPGVSKALMPASLWCQHSSGTKPLVSASLWCQHGSGVSMAYPFISDHHGSSVTGFLVSDFLVPGIYVRYSVCYFLSVHHFSAVTFPPYAIVFLESLFSYTHAVLKDTRRKKIAERAI